MAKVAALVIGLIVALLLAATLGAAPRQQSGAVANQQNPGELRGSLTHGSYFFQTYCATCHGTSARGDGPLADSLRKRPANLTQLAKRNNGVYPKEMVFRIIDGRQPVRGHGGPDMPAWGDAFKRAVENGNEDAVRARIQALVDYLEAIQERAGEE
jgi:mono/diheme cytochrome c family protein